MGFRPESKIDPDLQPNSTVPIGQRPSMQWEKWDAMICGLTAEQVCKMTPQELADLADFTTDFDGLHLGS